MSFAGGLSALVTSPVGVALAELPCRRTDPELFFAESPADVETAKALCVDCPIRTACLAGALDRREPWGVWGGELFIAGVVVARKRPRGRPRKNPVEPAAPVAPAARSGEEAA
jgi:WhiB family transcriptional regulator, redox-sensing transcriptional regulator